MEKKTIGGFIATLRKANGMTQKELAERLNVSDKTISRWERDDGAPDLAVIPVIAELFGVTCDELLRGERRPAEERTAPDTEETVISMKGEKAIKRLLAVCLSRYRMHSLISVGIALAGLIAAMIANLGFLRGYIGFFLGLAFYAASAICQWIFTDRAFLAVAEESLDDTNVAQYRWDVFRIAMMAFGAAFGMLFASLPLLLTGDAYYGLSAGSWLGLGVICVVIAVVVWYVVCCVVRARLLRRGRLTLPEDALSVLRHNMRLQRRIALVTAIVLLLTLVTHFFVSEVFSAWQIARGQEFTDYDSFAEYMAWPSDAHHGSSTYAISAPFSEVAEYQDANTRVLTLQDGTVVCEYQHLNGNVVSFRYTERDGSLLPIEVVTYGDVEDARVWVTLRNVAFSLLYIAEVVVAFAVYRRRRVK